MRKDWHATTAWLLRAAHRITWGAAMAASVAALATSASVAAATPPQTQPTPLPAELFFQQPAVHTARLSPSGRQLAITTARGSNRVGLLVIDLSPGFKQRWVARTQDLDVVQVRWVDEQRLVFGLADLNAGSGSDYVVGNGLFTVRHDGSEFRRLVRREAGPPSDSRDRSLSVEHVLLHIPAPDASGLTSEVIVGRVGRDREITPLALNVMNGRTRALDLTGTPSGVRRWMFDAQGRPVAVGTFQNDRPSTWVRRDEGAGWVEIPRQGTFNHGLSLDSISGDGTLYVAHAESTGGHLVLSRVDRTTLKPVTPPVVRAPGFDFEGDVLYEDGRAVGVRLITDAETTVWFDDAMKAFQAEVDQRMPGRINSIDCRRCGTPQMLALVRSYSDQDPGQLWLFDAGTKAWNPISRILEGIDPARMAQVDFHRFKARDGLEIPVWVTRPPGLKPGERAPAVVMVHGGPWIRGGRWGWNPWEQFLASRGYVVISPEFRGSTGYGLRHFTAGWRQWGRAMQDDVADALKWAQNKGLASEQACIAGASYGGYSTLMGLIRHPELYRCGVAWVAVTDLVLTVQGSWRILDDVSEQARRIGLPIMVGDPVVDEKMLREHSPVEQAHRIQDPVLLGFGEEDLRVPLAHGTRIRKALQDNPHRVEVEWVSYPGEAHTWRQVKTRVDFAGRMERFLARHLNPPSPESKAAADAAATLAPAGAPAGDTPRRDP